MENQVFQKNTLKKWVFGVGGWWILVVPSESAGSP